VSSAVRQQAAVPAVVAGGCALLVARPLLYGRLADPTVALVVLFTVLLAVGWAWPAPAAPSPAAPGLGRGWSPAVVLGIGLAAFAAGRLLGGLAPSAVLSPRLLVLTSLAAVAEEAFFRRLLYDHLDGRGGAVLAVAGTTVLFAIVHITVYGAWAMPIDAAAGLLLGWQRFASGSWRVPAVTHVAANIMMLL
jgi:membrane protease YdiL (CAAX protease family)